mmetsp:Transcript_3736/g.9403  ORF Transcript_3736/g.9403 Transcript_3736/m.9403 type:complete len:367 (+) Transcript_3736:47-1147(+)
MESTGRTDGTDPPLLHNPTIRLHNGVEMPTLQLGTAHIVMPGQPDAEHAHPRFVGFQPERCYRQADLALTAGMRAFDTAVNYRSDVVLGRVLGEWFRRGKNDPLQRPDVWITTKVMNPRPSDFVLKSVRVVDLHTLSPEQVAEQTQHFVEMALQNLAVGYVDLLLLHWPSASGRSQQGTVQLNRKQRLASWRVLEDAYRKGWVRAIGVSNYSVAHLEQLQQDGAEIVPMVNQIEASVTVQQREIWEYCRSHHIVPQAYSCLRGLVKNPNQQQQQQQPSLSSNVTTVLNSLSKKYQKDTGQIVYRYLIQLGYAVVYLTNSQPRMASNTEIWDFALTENEMSALDLLSRNGDFDDEFGLGYPKPDDCL